MKYRPQHENLSTLMKNRTHLLIQTNCWELDVDFWIVLRQLFCSNLQERWQCLEGTTCDWSGAYSDSARAYLLSLCFQVLSECGSTHNLKMSVCVARRGQYNVGDHRSIDDQQNRSKKVPSRMLDNGSSNQPRLNRGEKRMFIRGYFRSLSFLYLCSNQALELRLPFVHYM